jgi:glutamate-1-semialdehyde 2,1-aminomutase
MEREKSWEQITNTGLKIRSGWQQLADKHGVKISHWGIPSLTGFTVQSDNALEYKTIITQNMLSRGYLASNSVYVSTEHKQNVLDGYFNALEPQFALIKECEDGRDPNELLNGPVCHSGFKRLN